MNGRILPIDVYCIPSGDLLIYTIDSVPLRLFVSLFPFPFRPPPGTPSLRVR